MSEEGKRKNKASGTSGTGGSAGGGEAAGGGTGAAPDNTSVAGLTTELKNNIEAIEKLRLRRKEIKSSLNKEVLSEAEEGRLAGELTSVSKAIAVLEGDRTRIYNCLGDVAASPSP